MGACGLHGDGVISCIACSLVSGVWCSLGSLLELLGSAVKVWSLIWPKDLRCRCLVAFRRFEGACGLHSQVVVPFKA